MKAKSTPLERLRKRAGTGDQGQTIVGPAFIRDLRWILGEYDQLNQSKVLGDMARRDVKDGTYTIEPSPDCDGMVDTSWLFDLDDLDDPRPDIRKWAEAKRDELSKKIKGIPVEKRVGRRPE